MRSTGGGFCPPSKFPLKLVAIFLGMAALGMVVGAVTRPVKPKVVVPPPKLIQATLRILVSYGHQPALPTAAIIYFDAPNEAAIQKNKGAHTDKSGPKIGEAKKLLGGGTQVEVMVQPLIGDKPEGSPVHWSIVWPDKDDTVVEKVIERPYSRPGSTASDVQRGHVSSISNSTVHLGRTATSAPDNEYDFLATRPVTPADMDGKTPDQLAIMSNWPLAKHGQRFTKHPQVDYFPKRSWYKPSTDDAYGTLSEIERANVDTIKKKRGL